MITAYFVSQPMPPHIGSLRRLEEYTCKENNGDIILGSGGRQSHCLVKPTLSSWHLMFVLADIVSSGSKTLLCRAEGLLTRVAVNLQNKHSLTINFNITQFLMYNIMSLR